MTKKLGSDRIRRKKTRSNRIRRKKTRSSRIRRKTSGVRSRRLSGKLKRNIILRGGMGGMEGMEGKGGRPGWATLDDPKEQLKTYDAVLDSLLGLSDRELLAKYESDEVGETQAELMAICKDGVCEDEAFQEEVTTLMVKSKKLSDKLLSIAGGLARESTGRLKSAQDSFAKQEERRKEELSVVVKGAMAETQRRLEAAAAGREPAPATKTKTKKHKPNEKCVCGSGKKFKKCCGSYKQ